VNGGVDEVANTTVSSPTTAVYNEYSYYINYSVLASTSWASQSFVTSYWGNNNNVYNGGNNTTGITNPAPDEFDFTLPTGVTGSFYYNHLGQWVVKSKDAENLVVSVQPPRVVTIGYDNTTGDDGTITLARAITTITITDSKGFVYTFGSNTSDRPIEFSRGPTCGCTVNPGTQSVEVIATAWYLTQIISPSGNVVNFNYVRPENQYVQGTQYPNYNLSFSSSPDFGGWLQFSSTAQTYTGQVITPSYLSTITANLFTVDFNIGMTTEASYNYNGKSWYNAPTVIPFKYADLPIQDGPMQSSYSSWYQLNSITINDFTGTTQEQDKFFYTSSTSQRLFLNEFDKANLTGGGDMPYYFTYNSTPLPPYNAMQQDLWGYYNGNPFPSSLTSSPNPISSITSANASSILQYFAMNASYAMAGILQTITYPTGGTTSIVYEPNDYSSILQKSNGAINLISQTGQGGGLRIKSISNSDNNGNTYTKSYIYKYFSNGTSSGILNGYNQVLYDVLVGETTQGNPSTAISTVYGLIYDDYAARLNYTDGRDVVYSEVQEQLPDGSINIYDYSNSDNPTYRDEPPLFVYSNAFEYTNSVGLYEGNFITSVNIYSTGINPFMSHSSRELERGQLLTLTSKNAAGNIVKLVQNTYNSDPTRFTNTSNYVRSYDNYSNVGANGPGIVVEQYFQAIKIYTYFPYLQSTTTTVYDQNGNNPVTTSISYTYDNYRNLISKTTTSSEGETVVNTINYAPETISGLSTSAATAQTAMANQVYNSATPYQTLNMAGIPLEKITTRNGVQTEHSRTDYQLVANSNLNNNNILPAAQYQSYSTNALEQRFQYTKYDNFGNILEQQKISDLPQAYIWDYKNSYPIAEVTNANQVNIAYTSFEADGKGNWVFTGTSTSDATSPTGTKCYNLGQSGGAITISGLTSTLTYTVSYWIKSSSPLLIAGTISGYPIKGKTTTNGLWTCYTHNITGQTSLTISGSYYIDELRLFPLNALMTTHTFTPLVGMTSQTDPNNRTTYFQYDGLNRLYLVLDQDLNVIKEINYAYQNELFLNTPQSSSAVKNNCPAYDQGISVTYTVPAGTYSSPVSVAAANTLALNYAIANAQTNANTIGTCNIGVSAGNTLSGTFTVTVTNTSTNKAYTFTIGGNSSNLDIGYIPPGTYNVKVCPPSGNTTKYCFEFGTYQANGTGTACLTGSGISVNAYGDAAIYVSPTGQCP